MLKFKLPILVPKGLKPVITQGFADTGMVAFYKSKGINLPFHNGTDFVLSGTDRQTYGSAIITPEGEWRVIAKYWDNNPMAANGNEIVIHSAPFDENGTSKVIELRFVHLSEVCPVAGVLPSGTILGYLGNSGLVDPAPTPDNPYAGTHLHLGMCEYNMVNGKEVLQNASNGVYGLLDPLTRIDVTRYDIGDDTSVVKDAPPLLWGIRQKGITDIFSKIIYVWKVLKL